MKLNVKKYFEEAKKNKLTPFQLSFSNTTETTISVFNDIVEEQTIGTSISLSGKGIINNKLGLFTTEKIDSNTPVTLVNKIIESSKFGREEKKENFFSGGLKYKKAKIYSKNFVDSNLSEIKEVALDISKSLLKKDKRVSKAEVTLAKVEDESILCNDLGLNVKEKSRYYVLYLKAICEEKGEPRTGHDFTFSFNSLDELKSKSNDLITQTVKQAVDFFNSGAIKSGKYKVLLSPKVAASLLKFYVSGFNAKSCQKHISSFENKKGQQICSKSITLKHTPHTEVPDASCCDNEGYPSKDFVIINKGKLENYFYSLETARNDKVEPNGCGLSLGEAGPIVMTLQPSKKTEADLISKIKKGLYISDVSGLNAGIDGKTLNFSLPCEGYEIIDGKVGKATSMIICAGNLKDLFMDVIGVGNNVTYYSSIFSPSILVKKLAISGK